jgi:hypothetical protein
MADGENTTAIICAEAHDETYKELGREAFVDVNSELVFKILRGES